MPRRVTPAAACRWLVPSKENISLMLLSNGQRGASVFAEGSAHVPTYPRGGVRHRSR
jgi:hypothetical protein